MWNVDAQLLADELVPVITLWREAANQGAPGMTAVAAVIRNRAVALGVDPHQACTLRAEEDEQAVCLKKWQFSSMSAPGDPGLQHWSGPGDAAFKAAFEIWQGMLSGALADPTRGATLYYATSIPPPHWVPAEHFTVQIGSQRFYRDTPLTYPFYSANGYARQR